MLYPYFFLNTIPIPIVSTNGVFRLPTKVPATAATWIVTAFSLDPVTGLAITKTPFKLDVVQPLSIGLSVPPSVKRGEVLSIPIAVTSRLDSSATVEVTLHNEEQNFEFVDVADKAEASSKYYNICLRMARHILIFSFRT